MASVEPVRPFETVFNFEIGTSKLGKRDFSNFSNNYVQIALRVIQGLYNIKYNAWAKASEKLRPVCFYFSNENNPRLQSRSEILNVGQKL